MSWSLLFELYYAGEWVIRILMLFEVPRNRNPASATTWLMVIMFFPWIGLILYIFFGAQRPPKHRLYQKEKLLQALSDTNEQFAERHSHLRAVLDQRHQKSAEIVKRSGGMDAMGGNNIELIDKSEKFISQLIADIDSASLHVHLLFYIFENDSVGRKISAAVERAADRGVDCRMLLDAMGSRKFLSHNTARLRKKGINITAAFPILSIRHYLGRLDWRTHRKIAVIDGITAYTGSQNIVDPGYGHDNPDLVWQDLVARISGPVVISLQIVFLSDWYLETNEILRDDGFFPAPENDGNISVQALPSGPVYSPNNYQRMVITALYYATKRVIITTPYFIPDEAMLNALESACRRGVELNLVIPKKSDQFLPGYAARSYYEDLMKWGASIHLFTGGLLHAKSISIDDSLCFFGSSNFDIRSFTLNFEIDLVFYGAEANREIRKHQQAYISQSELLNSEEWNNRGFLRKSVENLTRLLSPML